MTSLSEINQTAIGGIPGNRWKRRYDPTGNWRQVEIDKVGGRWSLEDRVHDKGNRLMQVDQHEQSQQPPVEVDAAGRMTKVPLAPGNWTNVSNVVKWDAWNRIVEVQFSASVTGAYAYDALHRRIKRTASGVTWHSYFNDAWKVIEERRASHPAVAAAHYLWGLRHRDDLARRDRATTAGGSMSQRHYVLMDYHSPVAITGTTGTVQERYQFDGFGTRVVLNAGNTPIIVSAYAWSFAFQGQFQDEETGWLNYGFRYYAPGLGRFLSKDPIMEAGGNNLYMMAGNAPVNAVDWLGLATCEVGEKRNCKITRLNIGSSSTVELRKSLDRDLSDLNKLDNRLALASMVQGAGAVGKAIGEASSKSVGTMAMQGLAQAAETGAEIAAGKASPSLADQLKKIGESTLKRRERTDDILSKMRGPKNMMIDMTVSFEECTSCFFGGTKWELKTNSDTAGPFNQRASQLAGQISSMKSSLCK
jgi:RHS repeat-associated protein